MRAVKRRKNIFSRVAEVVNWNEEKEEEEEDLSLRGCHGNIQPLPHGLEKDCWIFLPHETCENVVASDSPLRNS